MELDVETGIHLKQKDGFHFILTQGVEPLCLDHGGGGGGGRAAAEGMVMCLCGPTMGI